MPTARRRRVAATAGSCRLGRFRIGGGYKPPRDLDLGGFGLAVADAAGGAVTLDFLELVAIDREIAACARAAITPRKRPQHGKHRRRRHQRKHEPQRHRIISSSQSGFPVAARPLPGIVRHPEAWLGLHHACRAAATGIAAGRRDIGKRRPNRRCSDARRLRSASRFDGGLALVVAGHLGGLGEQRGIVAAE